MAIGCLIAILSCEDDADRPLRSDRIQFAPDLWQPSSALTKGDAAAESDTPANTVTELPTDGLGTLYLHTLYIDSIASPISEEIEPDSLPPTKAAPVSEMYDRFIVSACQYAGTWGGNEAPNFMYDVSVSQSGTPSGDYYWPGSSYKLRFFAYAPRETAYALSAQAEGIPTLHCTVPAEVDKQKDLLVAASGEIAGDSKTSVSLTFHHALTAVRFACGDDVKAGTIKRITLKNVCSRGDYDLNAEAWSGQGTKASFSQTLDKAAEAGKPITTEAQTFMMIPQTLPDDAAIEVVFNDGTTDHTLNASIGGSGKAWPKGKTVTYKISTTSLNWEYFLEVTAPESFTYAGGTKSYSVKSYRKSSAGKIEPVAWKAQFSEDGTTWSDTAPDWLTEFTTSGAGGNTAATYNATVLPQVGISDNPHTKILREERPAKGTEANPYNLSNSTGASTVENTANCYVVDAPGWYSFPLVYGNAIKNGQTNEAAYTSTASGSNILSPFINHLGNGITDPYIANNSGCVPAKTELVWQDAPDLVTDIQCDTADGRIHFKVDKATVCQGNVVIAIKDASDTVLWSWHIWVTDETVDNTIEVINHQNVRYKFMAVNLGWCDGESVAYAARSYKVRFTAGGRTSDVTVSQKKAEEITSYGNSPYYQWGRKDPFRPSNGVNISDKIWYDANGTASAAEVKVQSFPYGSDCITNYILKPDVMQKSPAGDYTYYNLWSANNNTTSSNDNQVVKTIYDPCPVGFKMPASNAFTGFTATGHYSSTAAQINGTKDSTRKGWLFYAQANRTGQQIFFPAVGVRYGNSGNLSYVGSSGHYWSAGPYNQGDGRHSSFYSSSVDPLNYKIRPYGHSVRPVREE